MEDLGLIKMNKYEIDERTKEGNQKRNDEGKKSEDRGKVRKEQIK